MFILDSSLHMATPAFLSTLLCLSCFPLPRRALRLPLCPASLSPPPSPVKFVSLYTTMHTRKGLRIYMLNLSGVSFTKKRGGCTGEAGSCLPGFTARMTRPCISRPERVSTHPRKRYGSVDCLPFLGSYPCLRLQKLASSCSLSERMNPWIALSFALGGGIFMPQVPTQRGGF